MVSNISSLVVKNLKLSRGGRRIFDSLSWQLNRGEILHLRGANGSGKTSLLRCIAGLLSPESGEISFNPSESTDEDFDQRDKLIWLGVNKGLKLHETVTDYCSFIATAYGLEGNRGEINQTIDSALDRLGLSNLAEQPIGKLSTGQRQKLALTILLLRPASLWLLDEPSLGLDTAGEEILYRLISDHCQQGGMVVIASHHWLPDFMAFRTLEL